MAGEGAAAVLDLEHVTLVDVEGVRFLSDCEGQESNSSIVHYTSVNGLPGASRSRIYRSVLHRSKNRRPRRSPC